MSDNLKEKDFEAAIETYFINQGGYEKGNPHAFDRGLALDKETLIAFVKITQPTKWKRYAGIYGKSAEDAFIKRFSRKSRQTDS